MKKLTAILFAAIALVVLRAETMSDNGKAGYTGSPGEASCNASGCHDTYALNSGPGFVHLSSTMNNWQYTPGATYTINVSVGQTGKTLYGLGVEILTAGNANAGTFHITQTSRTQIKTRTVSGVSRNNVVHTLNGGIGTDSCVFSFDWTAPSTDIGTVTMYVSGNASNRNGSESGDYIYTKVQPISVLSTTSINDVIASNSFTVFPNPVSDNFNVNYDVKSSDKVKISLLNMNGSLISVLSDSYRSTGSYTENYSLPSDVASGTYLLAIESDGRSSLKKIIINK
jgi:hypothetical protein